MTVHFWIRKLFSRPVTRTIRKPPRGFRPVLEVLEDRRVPSTFVVNNPTDTAVTGEIDLRQAITSANSARGANTITFDSTVFSMPQTITLTGGQLELGNTNGTETITGPAAGVTVNGGGHSRVFLVDSGVTASISGLTITGGKESSFRGQNSYGGGLFNEGKTTLTDCTVSGNSAGFKGGGLYNRTNSTITLTDCTISGNTTGYNGGGLYNRGTAILTNCTVSGNSALRGGGGVFTARNYFSYPLTRLVNTIVSGNRGGDITGNHSGNNNLIGGIPLLAPLANYGGPTQTMALLPGSPAINAGTSGAGIPTTDQRGLPRVGAVDIGAFESQGFTFTAVAGSTPQTSPIGTPFANPLAVIVTANNPIEPVNGGVLGFVVQPAANGASALLSASSAVITNGQAAVTALPDNATGNYVVVASASGSSVSFNLTNAGPIFATLVVNTTSDSITPGAGLLSLREAIFFANFDSSGISSITFDPNVFATALAITLTGSQLELSNTTETETITGPAAGVTVSGGGISRVFQVDAGVTASLSGLTLTGGTGAGAGLYNRGTATLTNCTVSGNTAGYNGGGGLFNQGTATLTNCTVSGNSAGNGGGLYNRGTATLTNCTVSGNSARSSGGGSGLYNRGTATLQNTIVAGNMEGDIGGSSVVSGNNNLIGTDSSGGLVNGVTGNIVGVANPLLAPLGNYGGPTQTMALLPGSPAIDAGASGEGIPATDQRGLPRVGAVDIGAFESQGFTLTPVTGSTPQTSPIGTPFANPLAVAVTANNPIEPVDGGIVSFVANPAANGALAFLSASSAVIAGGQAALDNAEPNNIVGSYTVVASATGSSPVSFALSNAGPVFTSLVVNTTSDSLFPGTGLLSLPEAIAFANLDSTGTSTITFNPDVFATPQTITLTGSQLELSNTSETETITGPAAGVTINANGLSRVFQVDAGVTASLSELTLTNGSAGAGAGLDNFGITTLTNCTITGNAATNNGGGLYTNKDASATLTYCTVSGNSAGTNGGGMYTYNGGSAMLTNCTVSGNYAARNGAGLYINNGGSATLTNCTISNNSARNNGGGLYTNNGSSATLNNCTVSGNSDGLQNGYNSTTTLQNTIVTGNYYDIGGQSPVSGNNNLIGTGGSGGLVNGVNGNIVGVANPLLAPLGDYGGPTQTIALLPGSPAIDAGTSGPGIPTTDQRGLARVGPVDIGAFESQGFTLTPVPGSTPQTSPIGTPFAISLTVTVTANNPIEPVDGGIVGFVANPAANGASAFLSASSAVIGGGQAALDNAEPDNVVGSYTVVASATGSSPATFALTNAGPAFTSLVVNTTSDSLFPGTGLLSLREAIAFANLDSSGTSTITFDPDVFATPQTITLTGSQLELTNTSETETITGPAAGVTVSGGGLSRVFQFDAGVTASLSGLTLTGGSAVEGGSADNGGGFANYGMTTLTNCTITGNSATNDGGGLYTTKGGRATLTYCTVSGNNAGQIGGGLDINNGGSATLTNCTVSGNTASNGSGLYDSNGGSATLTNCTISGNSNGGSLYINNGSSATLTNCTVSGNSDGVQNDYNGTLTLQNTIVAGNTYGDITGSSPVSGNHDLIGTVGSGGLVNGVNGNIVGVANPLLAPLGNYGGPTQTIALLPGSPATDAGASGPGIPAADQRGLPRVGPVDIGAFESQGFTLTPIAGSTPQTSPIGTPFANPLAVTVTANNPIEPVDGGFVGFVAQPAANGASALLSASSEVIANGQVAVTALPDNATGSYVIAASVAGSSAAFNLTNTGPAFASLVVNTTIDSITPGAGLLSLREAIFFANFDSSGISDITFDPTVFATPLTITLTGTQLEMSNTSETETITGPTAGVTVSGGGMSRVFQVDAGVTASLAGLTLTGGSADDGGGLYNDGTTTLTNCTVTGNNARFGAGLSTDNGGSATLINCTVSSNYAYDGGGLYNDGTTTLTDCTVSGNSAQNEGGGLTNPGTATLTDCTISGNSARFGGGLVNYGGSATLTNCTVSSNSAYNNGGGLANAGTTTMTNCTVSGNSSSRNGGGLYSNEGNVTLSNCTVSGNSATDNGGGLAIYSGSATLTNCTVNDNQAQSGGGLAIYSGGSATLTNCTVSDNQAHSGGGGLYNYGGGATLTNCTVSGNRANGNGGGLDNYGGSATLTNCTVSGNYAYASGGGLANGYSTTTLTNCTVSGNSATDNGGGLYISGSSTATLQNTIVAGQTAGGDIYGAVAGSFNLIGTGGSGGLTNGVAGNIVGVANPGLAPLGNYGGPTQTMLPLLGSPAIDAGSNALIPAGVTTDQRGAGFPRIINGTVDIGAVETPLAQLLSATPNSPVTYGTAVTFTDVITVIPSMQAGTVTFYDGSLSSPLGSSNTPVGFSSTTVTYKFTTSPTELQAGPHSILACFIPTAGGTLNEAPNPLPFTVNPKALTVTGVTANGKVYDGTQNAAINTLRATLIGIVAPDHVTLNTGGAVGTFNTKNVGPDTVAISGLTLNQAASNYTLIQPSASATITVRAITVTASPNTKYYDSTTSAANTPTVTGGALQGSDTGAFTETYSTSAIGTGKLLNPAGSVNDGNGGHNYAVTFKSSSTGAILTVLKNPGAPTAGLAQTVPYGQPLALTFTAASAGGGNPAGTVQFFLNGATLLGTGNLISQNGSSSTWTYKTTATSSPFLPQLPGGTDSITASFIPTGGSTAVVSPALTEYVVDGSPVNGMSRSFDFNAGTSSNAGVTAAGFFGALGTDTLAINGEGWTTYPSIINTGTSGGLMPALLYQDIVYGYGTTFKTYQLAATPHTTYSLRLYLGDGRTSSGALSMNVRAYGSTSVAPAFTTVTTTAGHFNDFVLSGVVSSSGIINVDIEASSAHGEWAIAGVDIWTGNNDAGKAAQLATSVAVNSSVPALTQAQLAPVANEAVQLLAAAGLSGAQVAALRNVTYQIGNLPVSGALGLTGLGTELVQLDATAAGHGWYVGSNSANGPAPAQYDLLTVVMHELEHVIGQDDLSPANSANDLMTITLAPGERRLPAATLADGPASSVLAAPAPPSPRVVVINRAGGILAEGQAAEENSALLVAQTLLPAASFGYVLLVSNGPASVIGQPLPSLPLAILSANGTQGELTQQLLDEMFSSQPRSPLAQFELIGPNNVLSDQSATGKEDLGIGQSTHQSPTDALVWDKQVLDQFFAQLVCEIEE